MDMRDLLVLVEGEATAAAPYALSMGLHLKAHLTAVAFVQQRLSVGPFAELPHNLLESMYEESCRAAERALEQVRGTGFSWVETELMAVPAGRSTEDCFRWLARHFDLVIVQQRAPDGPVNDSTVEAALFGSGRPVLVVPYVHAAPARFGTVLIAWDESATAARAIGDALPLLKLADRVEVVTIAEPRRRERVSPPARLVQHLHRHGLEATFTLLPPAGGSAETLLSRAADVGADLLVMGGYGHSRLRELVLGGTTRTVLASMTVPTLMAH